MTMDRENVPNQAEFEAEFAKLMQRGILALHLDPLQAWALLGAVQLACRHPKFNGPTRDMAEDIAREIQRSIAPAGVLAQVADMGWSPEYDDSFLAGASGPTTSAA